MQILFETSRHLMTEWIFSSQHSYAFQQRNDFGDNRLFCVLNEVGVRFYVLQLHIPYFHV